MCTAAVKSQTKKSILNKVDICSFKVKNIIVSVFQIRVHMVSDGDDRKFLLFKQPALNLISGLLVHRGGPLINDKDRGMADERPGHCHTLALAAGQEAAVFSNRRVDALAGVPAETG